MIVFGMCLFPEEHQQVTVFIQKVTISIGRETKTHILPAKIEEQFR